MKLYDEMALKFVNTDLNRNVGGKLLRVRQREGVSQQNVADDLGFSSTTYSKLENGKVDFTVTRLEQLANYFKVNVCDFLDSDIDIPRLLQDMKIPADYKVLEAKYELLRELYEAKNK
ncbi:MAG: helix-turn-helix transcriptional regulator [Bacteroidales bacterium]|nr:helix-turn-helix domain-containing protein [Bacteroidales bacterium]MDD3907660.1 helix-turn-helix transcriptional regulator [Bacteroidales bacterium]